MSIKLVVFIVLALIAAGTMIWVMQANKPAESVVVTPSLQTITPPPPPPGTSIGSDIYANAQSPVADKLPETIAPAPNPLDGAYQNPFE